jgi:hypothetical protein
MAADTMEDKKTPKIQTKYQYWRYWLKLTTLNLILNSHEQFKGHSISLIWFNWITISFNLHLRNIEISHSYWILICRRFSLWRALKQWIFNLICKALNIEYYKNTPILIVFNVSQKTLEINGGNCDWSLSLTIYIYVVL